MNVSERSPVTQLHVTAGVLSSNYAFHLIAEGRLVCPFCRGFLYDLPFYCLQGFEVTHPDDVANMPDAFHHLASNDNFHYQAPLQTAKFDLFRSEKCHLANLVVN